MALKQMVEEGRKIAKTAERFPWGTTVVVALLTTLIVYNIMRDNVIYANKRAERAVAAKDSLVNKLLMKNNIIDRYKDTIYVQREIISEADSTIKTATEKEAMKILNQLR